MRPSRGPHAPRLCVPKHPKALVNVAQMGSPRTLDPVSNGVGTLRFFVSVEMWPSLIMMFLR